ncbi:hypothetical protein ABPG72_008432 [Tetrahymena utriculariae]
MKPANSNLAEIKEKLPKATKESYEQNGWKFEFQKGGIMPSDQLDQLCDYLVLNAIPDVVYGENYARFTFEQQNFCLEFLPKDSLLLTNFQACSNALLDLKQHPNLKKYKEVNNVTYVPTEVKVKYAEHWKNKKPEDKTAEIKVIQQISDVFFSTPYKGTVKKVSLLAEPQKNHTYLKDQLSEKSQFQELQNIEFPYAERTNEEIPIHNLTEQNPIKWANMADLWEDELGDSGSTTSEVRFRVMGDCWFALLRHYLRVDDVLIRIFDTRFYHEFGKNYILREFQVREDSYQNIAKKGFHFTPKWMLDQGQSHMVYQYIDPILIEREKIYFK